MGQCVECKISMGFTETNVAREHKGLCVACHVKSLVKQKVSAANKPHSPTNVKSIDNLFTKFEDMLITSETSSNYKNTQEGLVLFTGKVFSSLRKILLLKKFFLYL